MDKELPVVQESESPLRLVTSWTKIYRSLWEQPRHPYYIFCPDYRENSAGVLALHMLCHALNIAGHEAYVTAQGRNPRLRTPLLTPEIEEAHRAAQNTPITVYPEIVSGNPRNAEVVVRYLLNTPGHLAGDTSYAEHEILFAHRQQFVPPTMRAETLWIPVSDLRIFNPSGVDAAKRSGSCFYTSRYTERGGVLSSETGGFLELSQRNPRSLRELAEIFRRSEFLYSYEPSALCTQAMLCGCPVVYLPNDYMTEFPAEELLGRDGAAWGSSPEEIQRARDTVGLIFGKYQALAAGFDAELTNFIQISQKAADDYQAETTASAALPDSQLPEAFVLEPEWSTPDWASVLTAYLHAFLPGEPVALILAVEADQYSLEDAQHRVLEVVDDTGLQEFAEVLLVDKTSELEETLKIFHRVQWLHSGNEQSQLLEGAAGTRLAVAMQRLHVPDRLPMPVFDEDRPLRIAVFSMDRPAYACALIRLLHPLGFLGKAVDCHWAFTSHGTTATIDMQAVAKADVIVVQRVFPSRETAEIIDGLLRSGKPIIYETDDLLTEIPEGNSNNTYARENRDYLIDFIRRIDLVTVSTQALVGAYRQHNKRVYVLPNLINETLWVDAQHSFAPVDDTRPVTIGFAGTTTHSHDLALIESALERVVVKYGERVSFIFMGCITERLRQLPRVSFHEFADGYEGYARHLQTLDIDIALVPLADNTFNRCKSNIKWLEYSARGIAGVYSEITPYSSCIENGRTGMLVSNDSDAWFAALDHLIANPRTRQAIARSARDAVLAGYTLEKGASQYLRVYGKAIDIGETRKRDQPRIPADNRALVSLPAAWDGLLRMQRLTRAQELSPTSAGIDRSETTPAAVQLLLCANGNDGVRLAQTLQSLRAQHHDYWTLTIVADAAPPAGLALPERCEWLQCSTTEMIPQLNARIETSTADWLALLEAGDRLAPEALQHCVEYSVSHPDCRALYVDEDRIDTHGGRVDPRYKPDFNLELLRSYPYTGQFLLLRRDALLASGGYNHSAGLQAQELLFKITERHGAVAVGHITELLFHRMEANEQRQDAALLCEQGTRLLTEHLQRLGVDADVQAGLLPGSYFVDYRHAIQPVVSILIPTRDRLEVLKPCIESLLEKTAYPDFEVLVIDNGSRDKATLAYLDALRRNEPRVTVLDYPKKYNFAAINNFAAQHARGDYLLLLNNDTAILQANWLQRLMAQAQRPEVGVVGARLIFPDQRVQHAGIILGMGQTGVAEHAHIGLSLQQPGYLGRAQLAQELSAVTGACLLVRKSLYFEVGAMDEHQLAVMYNDVDLCLKLRQRGYQVIWTPFATLLHHGSVSLKKETTPDKLERARRETETMLQRWMPELAHDPAHNPNLSLLHTGVRPETDFVVPWRDGTHERPRIAGFALGSDGSWQYRVISPLAALGRHGRADCALMPKYENVVRVPSPTELERLDTDILLLHNTIHDKHIEMLEQYKKFSRAFRVFGADDLMFELPEKNPFQKVVYRDMKKRMRTCLSLCDRLIVTTEPLADAFRGMSSDIRVVPNFLERERWTPLRSLRRQGDKPRVGWAGATQHQGDLELLLDVVKETAAEVDWIFMGMCPKELLPYVREFHQGVSFEDYPAKLADLNLDLAVAPLEHNRFNEAKSHLRLLEYGALGWPVVCTNIHPYQQAPVERVANNPRAWINAIRERAHDLDACAIEGDRLRDWVVRHWLMEDHLDDWLNALQPESASGQRPDQLRSLVAGG